jgi:hypothetical protein
MGLEVGEPIATGAAVKISLEDDLLIGEVIYCRQEGSIYYAGVELEHVLFGLTELARIMRAFEEEYSGEQREHSADQAEQKHKQQTR